MKLLALFLAGIITIGVFLTNFVDRTKTESQNYSQVAEDADSGNQESWDYSSPKLPVKDEYSIVLVGDSMMDALGKDAYHLQKALKNKYPSTSFTIYNYGYGSTNLESLLDRLTTETENKNIKQQAILNLPFDIIILESFGHNPLSEYSLEDGLKKQEEILEEAVTRISNGRSEALIIFLATIGADEQNYASGVVDLSPEQRKEWAQERNTYIENHIKYAKEHNIPLIDVYSSTMSEHGTVDSTYIEKISWIHPSVRGVNLISEMIAEYLFENAIVPK